MISVVIISKDEPSLDETLTAVAEQLAASAEYGEIVVIDASEGRLVDIRSGAYQSYERGHGNKGEKSDSPPKVF